MPMQREKLEPCQEALRAAVAALPRLVRLDTGEIGFINGDLGVSFDTDALFDKQAEAREGLNAAWAIMKDEQPMRRGAGEEE